MKKSDALTKEQKEQIDLGKKIQAVFDTGYISRKQSLVYSFLKGMAGGAGAFIGGTIVIALLLWFLGLFNEVPLITKVINALQHGYNH